MKDILAKSLNRHRIASYFINKNYKEALELIEVEDGDFKTEWELFYSFMLLIDFNDNSFIEEYMNSKTLSDPVLLYFLLTNDYLTEYEFLIAYDLYLTEPSKTSFIGKTIKREYYLKYKKDLKMDILVSFINEINDWRVYEYALKYNVDLSKSLLDINDTNMQWYILLNDKLNQNMRKNTFQSLIRKLNNFDEITKVMSLIEYEWIESKEDSIMYKYCMGKFIKKADIMYLINNKENFDMKYKKLLLGILISKNEIILAYYFCYQEYKNEENYEIKLIYLFLNRYLCFYRRVKLIMKEELKLKNLLERGMFYVLGDLRIILSLNSNKTNMFDDTDELYYLTIHLIEFVNKRSFVRAKSIIDVVRNYLSDNVFSKEVIFNRFIGEDDETEFNNFLGEPCKFLFRKLTKSDNDVIDEIKFDGGSIENIYNLNFKETIDDSIFKNDYFKIDNKDFISYLKEEVKARYLKIKN